MQVTHDIRKLNDISSLVTLVLPFDNELSLKVEFDQNAVEPSHVEGFRKGKTPIHVLDAKIGREKYLKDLREHNASKALDEALKRHEIELIVKPTYEFADWMENAFQNVSKIEAIGAVAMVILSLAVIQQNLFLNLKQEMLR